jgi:copper chaperone CopZ
MTIRWLLLFIAWPALAQWDLIEIRFEGLNCASCLESLPERLKRVRGVETVHIDSGKGWISLKLAPQNRVRIEQIRDFIEQDGTKALEAKVEGRGVATLLDGVWQFRLEGQSATYRLVGNTQPEKRTRIKGRMPRLRGESLEIQID